VRRREKFNVGPNAEKKPGLNILLISAAGHHDLTVEGKKGGEDRTWTIIQDLACHGDMTCRISPLANRECKKGEIKRSPHCSMKLLFRVYAHDPYSETLTRRNKGGGGVQFNGSSNGTLDRNYRLSMERGQKGR